MEQNKQSHDQSKQVRNMKHDKGNDDQTYLNIKM